METIEELRTAMHMCEGKLLARYRCLEISVKNSIEILSQQLEEINSTKQELKELEEKYLKHVSKKEK